MKLFLLILLAVTNIVSAIFFVALEQQNVNLLFDFLENISNPFHEQYGQYLSLQEINNLISPSLERVTEVMNYAIQKNLKCVWFGDALKCENNPISLQQFSLVHFIESAPQYPKKFKIPYHPFNSGEFIGREVLVSLYNLTIPSVSKNTSICAVEYQGQSGFNMTDLYLHQWVNNESKNSIKHIIGVDVSADEETQLDIQMMSQTAENVDIWFWDNSAWLYSFAVEFMNTQHVPDILSMSWGWSESNQCDITQCNNITSQGYVDRVNIEYAKFGLRGVTLVVASGDAGAPGRTDELCVNNKVNPVFPGDSPFVTSVGATFIQSGPPKHWHSFICKKYGCNSGTQQFPTNYNNTGWTTGGGFSNYSPTPKWQQQQIDSYLRSGVFFSQNWK